ncbi:MAG: hypothetical protein K2N35_01800 [Muribaculaceae bacterium]|nr:hypothetical protein [Muribaculaceae bacterium]
MNVKKYAIIAIIMMLAGSMYTATYASSTYPDNVTAIYPQPDSRVDLAPSAFPMGLQQISILFTENVSVNPNCKGEAHLYLDGEETPIQTVGVSGASVDFEQQKMGCVLFPYSCKSNGNYRVTIPDGFWVLEGKTGGYSQAFELYYSIYNPQRITPAPTVMKELSEFRLEFPDYDDVKLLNPNNIELFKLSSDYNYPLSVSVGKNEDGTPANYIQINLITPITQPGEYCLYVKKEAAEAIYYGGSHEKPEPAVIRKTQNIEALYKYTVSQIDAPAISPAEGILEGFSTFELTVPQGADFWFANDKAVSMIYKVNDDGTLSPDASYRVKGQRIEDTDKILLNIIENGEIVENVTPAAGKYALQLAYGLFSGSWNGEFINSAPFIYYYYVVGDPSSIKLPSDADKAKSVKGIYSIDGKMISEKSGTIQINTLPEGIYIIDGKKTFVGGRK